MERIYKIIVIPTDSLESDQVESPSLGCYRVRLSDRQFEMFTIRL